MTAPDSVSATNTNQFHVFETIIEALYPRLPNVMTNQPWEQPPTGVALAGHRVAWGPIAWALVHNIMREILRRLVESSGEKAQPFSVLWTEKDLRSEILAIAMRRDFHIAHGINHFTDEFTSLMVDALTATLVADADALKDARIFFDEFTFDLSNGDQILTITTVAT